MEESEEATSAENNSVADCEVCEKSTNGECGKLCESCAETLKQVLGNCDMRLKEVKEVNKGLRIEVWRIEEVQKIRGKRKVFEDKTSCRKLWTLRRDFVDSVRVLVKRLKEKEELCEMLNEKQVELSEKLQKIEELQSRIKGGLNEDYSVTELQNENWKLKEKWKNRENENFLLLHQIYESLQLVRNQIFREQCEGVFKINPQELTLAGLTDLQLYLNSEISSVQLSIEELL